MLDMPTVLKFRSDIASLISNEGHARLVRARDNTIDKTYDFVFQPHKGSTASLDTTMHACAALVNRVYGPGVVMPRVDRDLPGHFALVAQASWFSAKDFPVVTDASFVLLFPAVATLLVAFVAAIVPSE